jgi:hypothetical protein
MFSRNFGLSSVNTIPAAPSRYRPAARLPQNAQRPTADRGPSWMLEELAVSVISLWTLPAWAPHEAEQPDVVQAQPEVQVQHGAQAQEQHEAELRRVAEEA